MISQSLQEAWPIARAQNGTFHPETEADRDEVRNQLQRILLSPAFQNSKRYAAVFKYIVDQTLNGFGDQLKERTIGIEVFNRPPDYDTSIDHAVRSAMAEIRKRLAQYYQGEANVELRIEVLPGSYTPQFRRVEEERTYARPHGAPIHMQPALEPPVEPRAGEPRTRRAWLQAKWLVAAGVILAACAGALVMTERPRGPLEDFWNPVFSSRAPVLLCIGNVEGGKRPQDANPPITPLSTLREFHNSPGQTVNVSDAFALAKLAGLLEANGRQFRFKSQSDATYADLQSGPAILVGLLNNGWTERLLSNLRFTVDQPTPDKVTIRDHSNPANNDWSIDYGTPYLNVTRDYALVLRVADPKTEQIVVVAAGITMFGTTAAGDFLTSPRELRKLAAIAPPGWQKKNMEIVLSTDVIRGSSGPPRIVAAQFW
ncbi:MAG TPA: hypothetical protein VMD55_02370 [Terracidiphilus sp.]|nr:hypothetical protein [Terracidiphilus sp.]